ncbi:DNA cytosine methyltransferase [Nostoc sp. CENA67]|uniref:DNA cytosine methyltransferase n=2 Tax=Amazonocrinis TaxID=2840440 RepID=A0A8J7HVE2_9NOST|nr:DNA cytosine methyltransferase [Amazonocrinis nigriterrae CENA67]
MATLRDSPLYQAPPDLSKIDIADNQDENFYILTDAKFKVGDRVLITKGKHEGKSAKIHEIKAENHICCWVNDEFYLHFPPEDLRLDPDNAPLHPWDSPQEWSSAGVLCKYENDVIFWGELQFQVNPQIKKIYLNPRVVVNFLEDSWCVLKSFIKYLAKYNKSATEKEIIDHYGCEKSLAQDALKLGVNLGFIAKENGKYSTTLCDEPPDLTDFATTEEFSEAWNKWTPLSLSKLQVPEKIQNTPKPVLSPDAPIAVVLFAGGGGIEAGMVEAGIRPAIAVEFDPKKPKLSSAIADCHEKNFSEYGCKLIRQTVQEVSLLGFANFPKNPDFLHASPMCSNFSNAKGKDAIETNEDIAMASAVVGAIRALAPKIFTLENVRRYRDSQSFKIIAQALEEEGYLWRAEFLRLLDCQARERFVVVAAKDWLPPLPPAPQPVGWYEVVADLIPGMADSELVTGQIKALEEFLANNEPTPLLIDRTGGRGKYKVKPAHIPCNTLLRSVFTDGKGANRNKFADIWLPDGTVKSVPIKAAARWQGFPSWYQFPPDTATSGSIIGYSVPPKFAAQLFKSLQQPPPIELQIQLCQKHIFDHNWRIQDSKTSREAIKSAKSAIASEQSRIDELVEELIIYRQFLDLGLDKSEAKIRVLRLIVDQSRNQ